LIRRIFIRGIPFETKTESLEKFFQKYGELDDCTIVTERGSSKSKGYGFVVFKDMDAAYAALDDPNKEFEGRKLICNLAALRDRDEGHAVRRIYVTISFLELFTIINHQ
jgi:RNA recognition motif-containing protein